MNPYYFQNTLPQQQILQANGKASIDALRLAPNSSVLIADQTAPIVWRCVSDSLGNVSSEAFDITPHKDEAQIEKENLTNALNSIVERLNRLENNYESFTSRNGKSTNAVVEANVSAGTENAKPASIPATTNFAKPKV